MLLSADGYSDHFLSARNIVGSLQYYSLLYRFQPMFLLNYSSSDLETVLTSVP